MLGPRPVQWPRGVRGARGANGNLQKASNPRGPADYQAWQKEPKLSGRSDRFEFNDRLWNQFLRIAQPYFLPYTEREDEEGPGFLALIAALLVGVVGGTFFLALAAGSVAQAFLPVPEGLTSTLTSMTQVRRSSLFPKMLQRTTSQVPFITAAGVAVALPTAAFYSGRKRLEGRWQQWGLLGLLLFLLFCVFRTIDNVLVAKDASGFYEQLGVFAGALVVAVPVISGYRYVRLTLGRYWRQDLTELFLGKNSQSTDVDNPDQRISEDVNYFTKVTLDFLLDVLDSVLNLISFSAILWSTSQTLTGALAIYALIGTYIAVFLGGRLVGLNYQQLRLQADFRYSLVHIRDNAEAIAFYGGEKRERREVTGKLDAALKNYDQLITWETGLSAYQKAFFYLARLVDFGTLGQAQFAFSMVLGSEQHKIETKEGSGLQLNMTLYTPDGSRLLVEGLNVALSNAGPQRRLLVVGSSGVGKSSVLRAVAGLWNRGKGSILRPSASEMLFLPQRCACC
eukprot:g11332.t1